MKAKLFILILTIFTLSCADQTGDDSANEAPTATNVYIEEPIIDGTEVKGKYTYGDTDDDLERSSTYQWIRYTNATCDAGEDRITDATSDKYTLITCEDSGRYFIFEVIPKAETGVSPGTTVKSACTGPATNTCT